MVRVSGLPTLGPRGEGWVAIQGVILVAIAGTGFFGPAWTGDLRVVTSVVGLALLTAGWILAIRGLVDLRDSLTALPHPRDDGRLVEAGAYRLVRHPIYGGLILGAAGWGLLVASPTALVGATVLFGFFDLKSRREEAWLVARYPGYEAYRRGTRRFFPLLY
jgi:protein-S-isoprenylcysteine O-methyltransferase Ste14